MSPKFRIILMSVIGAMALAVTVIVISGYFAASASAEDEVGKTENQEEAAQVDEGTSEQTPERFTVEGAPAGVARHYEVITDTTTGREYMIVFEGSSSVAFELDPTSVETAKAEDDAKKAEIEKQRAQAEEKAKKEDAAPQPNEAPAEQGGEAQAEEGAEPPAEPAGEGESFEY